MVYFTTRFLRQAGFHCQHRTAPFSSTACHWHPKPHSKGSNYKADAFTQGINSVNAEYGLYKLVTSDDLRMERTPPKRVKMLVRDFIEDSLYNPHYGYFQKQATIVSSPGASFNYGSLRNSDDFQEELSKQYALYGSDRQDGPGRQLWHTPSELFKPWYGQAIARCLVSEYLLKYFPYEDFIIYEIGAGTGTLAMDILNYIRSVYPDVYDRTRYNIIEISDKLVKIQRGRLCHSHPCVKVSHQSIFDWVKREPAPCFLLAMEVVDNFAHDLVRYDLRTLQPYEAHVAVNDDGNFDFCYVPVADHLISSLLATRRQLFHHPPIHRLLKTSKILRAIYARLPFMGNLSHAEYLPTRLFSFLQTLRLHFPRHRLLLSDFYTLPDSIPGVMGPVVQTRFRNTTVTCSTFLVKQGYFDVFFPTNFEQLRDLYEYMLSQPVSALSYDTQTSPTALTMNASSLSLGDSFFSSHHPSNRRKPLDGINSTSGLPVGERKSNVFAHAEFLETYADVSKTRLRNGENPMLDFYKNVKFLF